MAKSRSGGGGKARKAAKARRARRKSARSENSLLTSIILAASIVIIIWFIYTNMPAGSEVPQPAEPAAPSVGIGGQPPQGQAVSNLVEAGDLVAVNYIGMFPNGTVFDTSNESAAREAGVYSDLRSYVPIEFVVGSGDVIAGFEDNVVGMKVGDRRVFTVPPTQAYGIKEAERIVTLNRTQLIPRAFNFTLQDFQLVFGSEIEVGKEYVSATIPWPFTVEEVVGNVGYAKFTPQVGSTFTGLTEDAVVLNVTEDSILVAENPEVGETVYTPMGTGKVLSVTGGEMRVDFNHPMAGETLIFDVTVTDLMKAGELAQLI